MVKIEMELQQIGEVINRLPMRDKIRLYEQLRQRTWGRRIDNILKKIDRRRKRYKIPVKEISQEIEKARQEFYERRR